jgi:Zn-dependent peptidase ImmA (M78 family)
MNEVRNIVLRDVHITDIRLPRGVLARVEVGVGGPIILVNEAEQAPARRFGIAHEFAHLCIDESLQHLHEHQTRECRRDMRHDDETEQRCDIWAAELLAPIGKVDRYAPAELDLNPTTKAAKHALRDLIMRLGETFAVTESVIHLRLQDLVVFRQSSLQLR